MLQSSIIAASPLFSGKKMDFARFHQRAFFVLFASAKTAACRARNWSGSTQTSKGPQFELRAF
jgi:hypothetical protein